ncbi:MAG: FGGY-family carbohydrate kinase [Parasphingorhabdus sp.]|nr:FGGY-family carbohydrate kinase [Parasphingorhabdus sp.]
MLFLANAGYSPNPEGGVHCFCHALPNSWHQMSVILSAASCVEWAVRLTGMKDAAQMFASIEARNAPSNGEIFLPYLSGERTPHNNPRAKGVLFGLDHESDAATVGQTILEGVAFAFRDGMDALTDTGAHIETITVIGGGARSHYWGRTLASTLGRPLVYRDAGEVGPAYGAARLAQIADSGAAAKDICTAPPITHVAEPDAELADLYSERMPKFRSLYQNLKSSF